jgi:multidrug efflux pump subunit AcrB
LAVFSAIASRRRKRRRARESFVREIKSSSLVIDRVTASRLGITPQAIDNVLYDAFGQITTLFTELNQYHLVLETLPDFQKAEQQLREVEQWRRSTAYRVHDFESGKSSACA